MTPHTDTHTHDHRWNYSVPKNPQNNTLQWMTLIRSLRSRCVPLINELLREWINGGLFPKTTHKTFAVLMNKYMSNFTALVSACAGMIWWPSIMGHGVKCETKTNESGNKVGSPGTHMVPERHKIWHHTWITDLSPSSLCVRLSHPNTHLLIKATFTAHCDLSGPPPRPSRCY